MPTIGPRHEAGLWAIGLLVVAAADPTAPALIEVCLFKAAGLAYCPGCGLGHAVGFLARGELMLSIQSHPLVIPVVGILLHRIVFLIRTRGRINQPNSA